MDGDDDEDEFFDALDEMIPIQEEEKKEEDKGLKDGYDGVGELDFNKSPKLQIFQNYNAVDWWKYAGTCIIKDIRTRKGQ